MSLKAILWALHDAPTDDPQSTLVLVALAENAHDNGRYAWPSVATIARKARCSERTAHRRLRELEDLGLIRRGDQQAVGHLDARYRPVVYDLALHLVRDDSLTPLEESRGDTGGQSGVTPVADKPSLEPSTPHKPPKGGERDRRKAVDGDPAWDAFWSAYPRKTGKGAARSSWPAALDKVHGDHQTLVAAARKYAGTITEIRYACHPATWLRQERWLDDLDGLRSSGHTPDPNRRENWRRGMPECPIHSGQHADGCRGCAADAKAAD